MLKCNNKTKIKIIKVDYNFKLNNQNDFFLISAENDVMYIKDDYYEFLDAKYPKIKNRIINNFQNALLELSIYSKSIYIKYSIFLFVLILYFVILPIIIDNSDIFDYILSILFGVIVLIKSYSFVSKLRLKKYVEFVNKNITKQYNNFSKEDIELECNYYADFIEFVVSNDRMTQKDKIIDDTREQKNKMLNRLK